MIRRHVATALLTTLFTVLVGSSAFAWTTWALDFTSETSGVTAYIGEHASYDEVGAACVNGEYIEQHYTDRAWYIRVYGSDYDDTLEFVYDNGGWRICWDTETSQYKMVTPFENSDVVSVRMYGYDGDDDILGLTAALYDGGRQELYGGDDDDNITGADTHDLLYGGSGADYLYGLGGCDELYGEDGSDTLYLGSSTGDSTCTGSSHQIARGGAGTDGIYGTAGEDYLVGGDGVDGMDGYGGNDVLVGGAGSVDIMEGGDGNDCVYGFYEDYYYPHSPTWDGTKGSDGNDYLQGQDGNDHLCDLAGASDSFSGGNGTDYHWLASGGDTVSSSSSSSGACGSCYSVSW